MKTHAIVLLALLAVTAVEASASEVDLARSDTGSATPSRSREAVREETRRALAAREVAFGDVLPVPVAVTVGRSREAVRDETLMALMERSRAGQRSLYAN